MPAAILSGCCTSPLNWPFHMFYSSGFLMVFSLSPFLLRWRSRTVALANRHNFVIIAFPKLLSARAALNPQLTDNLTNRVDHHIRTLQLDHMTRVLNDPMNAFR
jgi:hypothetical protein